MQVTILEDKKNKLVFELDGDKHTLPNLLKDELNVDEHVKIAGYNVDHPLVGKPRFILETDGADPRKTLNAAVKRLGKTFEKLHDEFQALKI